MVQSKEINTANRIEIMDEAVCFPDFTNILSKIIKSSHSLSSYG